MKTLVLIAALLVLGACGIDGPPSPPDGGGNTSGEARIGVVGAV